MHNVSIRVAFARGIELAPGVPPSIPSLMPSCYQAVCSCGWEGDAIPTVPRDHRRGDNESLLGARHEAIVHAQRVGVDESLVPRAGRDASRVDHETPVAGVEALDREIASLQAWDHR